MKALTSKEVNIKIAENKTVTTCIHHNKKALDNLLPPTQYCYEYKKNTRIMY